MLNATIDDAGTNIAFLDSGRPEDCSDYTTLVCVHGHTYHAENFRKLIEIAPKYNLRVVALQRRDYAPSSLFTEAELEALNGKDPVARTAFFRERGLEIAKFLLWLVEELKIPEASITDGGQKGGLALMGWSLGNVTTLAFLGNVDSYPPDIVRKLEKYLKTLIIYECSYTTLGYPTPQGAYHPLADLAEEPQHRPAVFHEWVSSFFDHPDLHAGLVTSLQLRTPVPTTRPPTHSTFTEEELAQIIDLSPGPRSEAAIYGPDAVPQLSANFQNSVLNGELAVKYFPDLRVKDLYCSRTIWSIPWGIHEVKQSLEESRKQGGTTRPVQFVPVENANHFLHWEAPELAMETFANCVRM